MAIANNTWTILLHQYIAFMRVKACFAILQKYFQLFPDFNFQAYQTKHFHYYFPYHLHQWAYVYLIAGIVIPLWINKNINLLRQGQLYRLIFVLFPIALIAISSR